MAKNNHLVLKAGLSAAAVAAAAGAYYFFGKDGAKNRKTAQAWVTKAKTEVLGEVKKLKTVNLAAYSKVSGKVVAKYKKFQKDNPEAYALLARELKAYWPKIAKHLPKTAPKTAARAK